MAKSKLWLRDPGGKEGGLGASRAGSDQPTHPPTQPSTHPPTSPGAGGGGSYTFAQLAHWL